MGIPVRTITKNLSLQIELISLKTLEEFVQLYREVVIQKTSEYSSPKFIDAMHVARSHIQQEFSIPRRVFDSTKEVLDQSIENFFIPTEYNPSLKYPKDSEEYYYSDENWTSKDVLL